MRASVVSVMVVLIMVCCIAGAATNDLVVGVPYGLAPAAVKDGDEAFTRTWTRRPTALLRLSRDGVETGGLQLDLGWAWYHDHRGNVDGLGSPTVDAPALYAQVPVAGLGDWAYISFGGFVPFGYVDRARPEFSLNTRVGSWWAGHPPWLDPEVGVYVAASPWNAFGVMVGLVHLRF